MNIEKRVKPPGIITRIISCIPMFNWISLIIIGLKCKALISLVCGIVYGWISFTYYNWAPFLWVVTIFQYNVVYCFYDVEMPKDYNNTKSNNKRKTTVQKAKMPVTEMAEGEIKAEEQVRVKEQISKEVDLDFEKIGNLRKESDYVRAALEVD